MDGVDLLKNVAVDSSSKPTIHPTGIECTIMALRATCSEFWSLHLMFMVGLVIFG